MYFVYKNGLVPTTLCLCTWSRTPPACLMTTTGSSSHHTSLPRTMCIKMASYPIYSALCFGTPPACPTTTTGSSSNHTSLPLIMCIKMASYPIYSLPLYLIRDPSSLPYDHNRVLLTPHLSATDYVNASWIRYSYGHGKRWYMEYRQQFGFGLGSEVNWYLYFDENQEFNNLPLTENEKILGTGECWHQKTCFMESYWICAFLGRQYLVN